jgi:hypothetical protein
VTARLFTRSWLAFVFAGVLCGARFACAASAPMQRSARVRLSDLRVIEKHFREWGAPDEIKAVCHELWVIRKHLRTAPVYKQREVLHRLVAKTKWGTRERAAASYVSVWYGVDYPRSKRYLMNVAFWPYGSGMSIEYPFSWGESGAIDMLFRLYDHNHDFHLLHDLFIRHAGDDPGETLDQNKDAAFAKHPRGLLHVAAISKAGYDEVIRETGYLTADIRKRFLLYCRRIAQDRTDPLSKIAMCVLQGMHRQTP